jgi:hybrid cluster-associated redox disulfide protein
MLEDKVLDLSVAEIMTRWPATVAVFINRHMHCVGCPISAFHTLAEAAAEHGLPLAELTDDILQAVHVMPKGVAG